MAKFVRLIGGGGDAEGKQVGVYFERRGLIRLSAQTVEGNPVRNHITCLVTGKRRRTYVKDALLSTDTFNALIKQWERGDQTPSAQAVRRALEFMGYQGYSVE